jgi:hypothetical protein
MSDRCNNCSAEVRDRRGLETPTGETLCGSCYFAIWGLSGAAEITQAAEALAPASDSEPRRGWFR